MEWIPWILGGAVAVFVLGAMLVFVAAMVARTWGGEAVGAMRVRKRYMNGTHKRLRASVRRSVRGKAAMRDVHLLVGSVWYQSALLLSQVDAVRCAEMLERAAADADSRP
jgi:hypothetical protein